MPRKIRNRNIESSSQGEALTYMEEHPEWMTTEQVAKGLNLTSREKVAKYLRKLEQFRFIERRRIPGSNELEYKIRDNKTINTKE